MENIFRTILNMSITGAYIAAAIMVIRLFMKKLPKKYSYALWSILGIRLLCPFSFSSAASLFNLIRPETTESRMTYIPDNISHSPSPSVTISVPEVNEAINNSLPAPVPEYSADPMQIIMSVCSVIWLVGVGAMLIYTAVSFIKVWRLVMDSEHLRDNIYLCDNIGSPFVFGYIRPRIYIPKGVSEKDIEYIAAHENTHIRRGDHIIKLLATAALSIHWFNPPVWLSYKLMSKDMELSCDERAVRSFEGDVRREYANALLNMSLRQNRLYGLLGFGETGIKSRIKGVLSLKKPTVIATISAVILLAIAAVCLLTNAEKSGITLEKNAGSYSVAAITYKGETETKLSDGEYIQNVIDNINGARLKTIRESDLPDIDGGIYLDYAFRMYKSSDFTGEYDSFTVCRSGDVFYAVYESEGKTEYYKMSEKCYNELCVSLSDAPGNGSDETNISENETTHISENPSQIRNSVSYELDWSADIFRTVECCGAEITIPCKLSDIDKRFKTTDIGTSDKSEYSNADLYFNNELVAKLSTAENKDIASDDVKAMLLEVFSIDGLTETSSKAEIQSRLGAGNILDTENDDIYFSGNTWVSFMYINGKTSLFVCAYDENEAVLVLNEELEQELEFCLSYITDYWNDLMKIGDFYPEKYISDPDMLMYANAKKKVNEDTFGHGVKSLEAKSGIGKVLSGITDEGRIWLSFTYDIELNLEDGTTDNEHYNGYTAYFELEDSGDDMKVYRQYDMWGPWLEELGIEGIYDEPSDLQYVDVVKARERIHETIETSVSTEPLQSTEQEESEFDPYDYDINLLCEDPEDPTNSDLKWLYINEFTSDTVCKEMEIISDRVDLTDFPVNENITYLKITALKGNTLAGIENFPNLEMLFLNGLFINITDISDIYKCPKINTLILRFVGTVEDFSVVSQLPDLEEFVAYTGVPEATLPNIESLASCKKLTKLILQDFDIGSIDFISELTNLRELRLWSSDFMIDDISPLSSLTNLEELEIRQYNSEDIEPYLNLKNLKYLDIDQNIYSEETKNRLYEAFPEGVVKINNY